MPQQVTSRSALLLIDFINDLAFPGGEKVLPWAQRAVEPLARCAARLRRARIPIIYANDNFGHWRSNFADVYRHCSRKGARGRSVVRAMKPHASDYFVLKPRHSAFFATALVPLLERLKVDHLIMAGIATNLCVLSSAIDAHMREYRITVLSDCCAAESDGDHNWALSQLSGFLGVRVCRSDELRLSEKPRSKAS